MDYYRKGIVLGGGGGGAESVCNICPLKQSLHEIRHDRKKFSCKLNRMLLNHHASSLSPLYDSYIYTD